MMHLSIRSKIILIVLLCTLILIGAMVGISMQVLSKSYADIERTYLIRNLDRADDAIQNSVTQLGIKLKDWAYWDDTYEFIVDLNEDYAQANLQNNALGNLFINAMVFTDTRGEILVTRAASFVDLSDIDPTSINAYVTAHRDVLPHANGDKELGGIILLPEGPALFVASTILPTNTEGPSRGSMMFVKYIDDVFVQEIGELTHLSVSLFPYDATSLPSDVIEAKGALSNGQVNVILPSADTISAYKIVNDIDGDPILILRVEVQRDIWEQGKTTLYTFMLIAGGAVFLFGVIILFLIEWYLLSRLVTLEREVGAIGELKDPTKRVSEGAEDELGKVSRTINRMLTAVASAEEIERAANQKVLASGKQLTNQLEEIKKMNNLMVDRELKMIELKKRITELEGGGVQPPLPPQKSV
ncbi:MAG: CHASE4 domain-containing protein [Minisyncoccia bacterium]